LESLFAWQKTRARHREAPLLKEREEFLAHLLKQGCSLQRARSVATFIITILRVMEMSALREVELAEIETAARSWAEDGLPHGNRVAGPTSEGTFIYVAEKWLRFHGKVLVPTSTPRPSDALVDDFAFAMKQQRGLSPATIRGYRSRSALFLEWLADQRQKTLFELSLADVDAYLDSKRLVGWKARTLATQCQAMRTFLRYAEMQAWCSRDIAKGIKSPTLPKFDVVPQGPAWADVKRLLVPLSDKPSELRASAILAFFAIYGLRSSEVANLLLGDFDWANETFTVRRAKRGRIQQYPIQYEVGETLIRYLRHGRPHCTCKHVFVSRNPPFRPVESSGMWQVVAKRMARLGITSEHKGPHALRHACATQLLKKGSSLMEIADFLGHRDLKSVSIYAKYDTRSLRKVAEFSLAGVQ
jgi:integrase/recombinase XerD